MKFPIVFFILLVNTALPTAFSLTGSWQYDLKVNYNQAINITVLKKNIEINIPIAQNYNDSAHRQEISNFKISLGSNPVKKEDTSDQFGNHFLRAVFQPGTYYTISFEISFNARISGETGITANETVFPFTRPPGVPEIYFSESPSVIFSNQALQKEAVYQTVKCRKAREALSALQYWVVHEIENFLPDEKLKTLPRTVSAAVYERRAGTIEEKYILLAAMLRAVGFPVRFAGGMRFEQIKSLKTAENQPSLIYAQTKDVNALWIEAHIAGSGWIPVSLDPPYLGFLPMHIRTSAASDPSLLINARCSQANIIREAMAQVNDEKFNLKTVKSSKADQYMLLPPLFLREPAGILLPFGTAAVLHPSPVPGINAALPFLDNFIIDAENGLYAQRVFLPEKTSIKKIKMRLYRLEKDIGKIRISIIPSLDSREPVFFSSETEIKKMNCLARFMWMDFFPAKNSAAAVLDAGEYWILPVISGGGQMHWAFTPGSWYYKKDDACRLSAVRPQYEILNGDFHFQIIPAGKQ
ncbi:MAG: hypothetical protein A2096_11910 [Spirochaetes bacterium GWF1_41_5]|nr:MAG: hypothetical protein A2096_11910 [Spirochaetes bacterium GWF1_41_5]HBE01551.1 hypothetical protein [Spirochaetia bacterium]